MLNNTVSNESSDEDCPIIDGQPSTREQRIGRWIEELNDWAKRNDVAFLATLSPSKRVTEKEALDAHTVFVKFLRKALPRAFRKGLIGATVRETTPSGSFAGLPHFHTLLAIKNRSGQQIEEDALTKAVKTSAKRLRTPVRGSPVFEQRNVHVAPITDQLGLCKYLSKDLKSRRMRRNLKVCFFNQSVTADFVDVGDVI